MDKPDNVISLINLATVRSLEEQWGYHIDPLRFRANFYIDGAKPWEEFEWVGSDIRIGDGLFRVDRRNGRCGATNVNPETGRRDLDLPASLRAAFGHKELGIYLVAREGAQVTVGDTVSAPMTTGGTSAVRPLALHRPAGRQTLLSAADAISSTTLPPDCRTNRSRRVTSFSSIPSNWRCPDCGTDKTTFRPHVETQRKQIVG